MWIATPPEMAEILMPKACSNAVQKVSALLAAQRVAPHGIDGFAATGNS